MDTSDARTPGEPDVVCVTPTFGSTSDEPERRLRRAGARLLRLDAADRALLPRRLATAAALIVGTQPVDRDLVASAPRLRVIAKHGAGVDNIDVEAATEAGVLVTNAPGLNSLAVAEFTIGLMIAVARGIPQADQRVRGGEWTIHVGRQLDGATLGIVGAGAIGRLVARRAAAFGMRILYHDVVDLTPEPGEGGWRRVSFEELLEQSDFVTLHVPLLASTRRLVDARALRRMKPTAFLVNAARGELVDEPALDRALRSGEIAGAALDVFSEEPLPGGSALAAAPHTVLTPHTAAYTEEALTATSVATADEVVAVLTGRSPSNPVNRPAGLAAAPRGAAERQ